MARLIRNHWKVAIVNLSIMTLGIAVFFGFYGRIGSQVAKAQSTGNGASTTPSSFDPGVYTHISLLRWQLCLTDRDLAAYGCSQTESAAVLGALVAWVQGNASTWQSDEVNRNQAQISLRAAQRIVNIGPSDDGANAQLAICQTTFATANAQLTQLLQGAGTSIASILNSQQNQDWSIAQTNRAAKVPDQFLYVSNITSNQITALKQRQLTDTPISSILTADQMRQIAAALATQIQYSAGVVAAEQATLPPPPQMIAGIAQTQPSTGG